MYSVNECLTSFALSYQITVWIVEGYTQDCSDMLCWITKRCEHMQRACMLSWQATCVLLVASRRPATRVLLLCMACSAWPAMHETQSIACQCCVQGAGSDPADQGGCEHQRQWGTHCGSQRAGERLCALQAGQLHRPQAASQVHPAPRSTCTLVLG